MLTTRELSRLSLSIARGLYDSTRTDELLVAEELVCRGRFTALLDALRETIATSEEAQTLLRERPRLARNVVDFDALRDLPAGTLGGTYVRHLDRFNLDPDLLADPFGHWSGAHYPNPDAAYLHERYRQTHDLWHALTGLGVAGHEEVLIHCFTWGQLRLPYSAMIVGFGTLKHVLLERRWHTLRHDLLDAWRAGREAAPLLLVHWERRWQLPVDDIRRDYRIRVLAA